MSDLAAFARYARAFEIAYATDDWSLLEPHFTEDAERSVPTAGLLGANHSGRDAVIAGLRKSVAELDRRFDARIPEILDGPWPREEGVWMRYRLTLRRAGVPDLEIEGEHLAVFRDGRIARIEEAIKDECGARVDAHFGAYDAGLRAPGSPPLAPAPEHHPALGGALMRSLVNSYAAAKCHQDIDAALEVCTPGFELEAVGFGITSRNAQDARVQLGAFFESFPDYRVDLDGMAVGDNAVSCWGTAHVTWRGPLLGLPPTGKAASLPFASIFTFENGAISRERFFFDLADLCRRIDAPIAAVEAVLLSLREAHARNASNEKAA